MRNLSLFLALGAFSLTAAAAANAQAPDTVAKGSALYGITCGRCHNLRAPSEFGDQSWRTIMAQMRARANLTREQSHAILAFLQSANGVNGVAAPATAPPASPVAAPAPSADTTARAVSCPQVAPDLIARGRTIFEGPGNCSACHGPNAAGSTIAPNLRDKVWLNITGTYASIAELITRGVPKPKKYPAPMPAKGGAQLGFTQVCEVAAYIYSLSHGPGR